MTSHVGLSPLSSGPTPQVAKGTHVLIPLGETSATGWTAEEAGEEAEGEEASGSPALRLRLSAPADAPIGRYRLSVKTRTGAGEFGAPFDDRNDVIVLFNPWCEGKGGGFGGGNGEFGAIWGGNGDLGEEMGGLGGKWGFLGGEMGDLGQFGGRNGGVRGGKWGFGGEKGGVWG